MVKLWISDKLELRYSPEGWPDQDQQPHDYIKAIAKAKKESLVVDLSGIRLRGYNLKPDAFTELPIEIEFVKQYRVGGGAWVNECPVGIHVEDLETRTIARPKKDPASNGVRTITNLDPQDLLARLKKAENAQTTDMKDSELPDANDTDVASIDPGVGQYYDKAHGEIAPINQHVAIGWQQKFGSTNSPIIIPEDLQSRLDAANARIKELESNPADVLAVALIPPSLKARILDAFEKRKWKISEFHNTASDTLSEVLDELGIN